MDRIEGSKKVRHPKTLNKKYVTSQDTSKQAKKYHASRKNTVMFKYNIIQNTIKNQKKEIS